MKTYRLFLIGCLAVVLLLNINIFGIFDELASQIQYQLSRVAGVGERARFSVLRTDADSSNFERFVETANYLEIKQENEELRELLKFKERFSFDGVGADVISRGFDPAQSILIINRGKSDGVIERAPVIVNDGILIGIISEVREKTSLARLLTDSRSRIAGRILNKNQSEGIVVGGHGILVRVELIPRDEEIAAGDFLVTSGLDDSLPRGLFIGVVQEIEQDVNPLFNRAIIRPAVSYEKIKNVLVGVLKYENI